MNLKKKVCKKKGKKQIHEKVKTSRREKIKKKRAQVQKEEFHHFASFRYQSETK